MRSPLCVSVTGTRACKCVNASAASQEQTAQGRDVALLFQKARAERNFRAVALERMEKIGHRLSRVLPVRIERAE